MVIPYEEEKAEDIKLMLQVLKDNGIEGYEIKYDVRPYRLSDFDYLVNFDKKIIEVVVYSANYPHTFSKWYKLAMKECADKMKAVIYK